MNFAALDAQNFNERILTHKCYANLCGNSYAAKITKLTLDTYKIEIFDLGVTYEFNVADMRSGPTVYLVDSRRNRPYLSIVLLPK